MSLKNASAVFLFTLLSFALIGGPICGIAGCLSQGVGLSEGLIDGLFFGPIFGLLIGPIVALNRGGSAVIKHYALRLVLWLSDHTPLNLVRFLDQSAKLIFLKKVGGGYIFIHRMLLDYFADLPQDARGEDRKTE